MDFNAYNDVNTLCMSHNVYSLSKIDYIYIYIYIYIYKQSIYNNSYFIVMIRRVNDFTMINFLHTTPIGIISYNTRNIKVFHIFR